MKLNFTLETFREKLKTAIHESSVNSNVQEEIIDRITHRGYGLGFISNVFEGNIALDSLSLVELGVFALEIFNITNIGYINPSIYLEDIELDIVKRYKKEDEEELLQYPVVFEDVRQIAHDIWTVVVTAEFIAKLGRSNMLNYEFETQREAKTIETNEGIILTPTVNSESVKEITEELITDDFIPNVLTFNIPLRDMKNYKYDKKLKRWILLEGKLNIIDGYHRYLGIIAALRQKDIQYNFEIRLTNFDEDKARKFIVQEDKRNSISKEYIKSIDESDLITQLINRLNQNNKSELKGKITSDISTIVMGISLVSFELMYKTIDKLWKPKTINDSEEIFEYLRAFFNKLVGLYPEEFKTDIKGTGKKNNLNDERMFIIYLIIAKKLENSEEWRIKLEKIMKKVEQNNQLFEEYLNVIPSLIKRHFQKYFKMANNIVEVIINDR